MATTTSVGWNGLVLRSLAKCIRSLQIELEDPIFKTKRTVLNLIDQLHHLLQPLSSALIHHLDPSSTSHPHLNKVIINSEVWDLRKFRLLRSVPSLDQTTIAFNAHGDVIYAILRRNIEDVMSAFHTRRAKHPLFAAFRTLDAVNYSDIATTPVEHCVLDFTTEPTDLFVGLATVAKRDYYNYFEDEDEGEVDTWGCVKIFEIGHRRPTNDNSDDTSEEKVS